MPSGLSRAEGRRGRTAQDLVEADVETLTKLPLSPPGAGALGSHFQVAQWFVPARLKMPGWLVFGVQFSPPIHAEHRDVLGRCQHRRDAVAGEVGHLGVADHLEEGVEPDPRAHRAGLEVVGLQRLVARRREVGAERLVDREVEGRRRERTGKVICLAKSPGRRSPSAEMPRLAPSEVGAELLAGRITWTASCSPSATSALRAAVLRGEDELAEVGGAGRTGMSTGNVAVSA